MWGDYSELFSCVGLCGEIIRSYLVVFVCVGRLFGAIWLCWSVWGDYSELFSCVGLCGVIIRSYLVVLVCVG